MKRMVVLTAIVAALMAAVHAQGALTGKWQGETANGAKIELDLAATETVLTGTFTRNGQASKIADGKVSKATFTFSVAVGDQAEGFTGEVAVDQIKFWMNRQGPSNAIVLKRVSK